MMDQDEKLKYVIELPELRYDKEGILDFADKVDAKYWIQWISDKGVTAKHKTCELRHFNLSDYPVFMEIVDRFNPILGIDNTRLSLVKFPGIYNLPPHLDPIRLGAIILPLYPNEPAPIFWEDSNGDKVYEHVYITPTVINTQRRHGVTNDGRERMTVHIDLMMPWDDVLDLHRQGKLLV